MNEVRLVNYTLITAMVLLLAAYVTSMQTLAQTNNEEMQILSVATLQY
ncbi:TPA: hypothetical protein IAD52_01485 [Candidatus Spyradomonas excrementavium]|nr:hypothetical protein [Candidatus Spyradomonas excrementavium]